MAAKPIFPDDPFASATLPHNFVNPQGEEIGPADYFLNHSGLKGANLEAALASVGLEVIHDQDGKITGARSKQKYKFEFTGFKTPAQVAPRKEPEVLTFDYKRKIELAKE